MSCNQFIDAVTTGGTGGPPLTSGSTGDVSVPILGSTAEAGGQECPLGGPVAEIIRVGIPGKLLLKGTVVTPDEVFPGEVLMVGDTLVCVAQDCSPEAVDASVVDTHGVIFPGLISVANHILFNIFDDADWPFPPTYTEPNDWQQEPHYDALLTLKQHLNHEYDSPVDVGCELEKYGEIKVLVAGTTSIVASTPGDRSCYAGLARTIDQATNGLPADKIQTKIPFPSDEDADKVCTNISQDTTDAYLIHIAQGTSLAARDQFATLGTVGNIDGCLYAPETVIVHGTALESPELDTMQSRGMKLVWMPKSNLTLYGATAPIPLALSRGIPVALAPDWSLTGSRNLLDELRFADFYAGSVWPNQVSRQQLVRSDHGRV